MPVGTAAMIEQKLLEATGRECCVASNPEFLKEGAAIEDFQRPDRVVVGVRAPEVAENSEDSTRRFYERSDRFSSGRQRVPR